MLSEANDLVNSILIGPLRRGSGIWCQNLSLNLLAPEKLCYRSDEKYYCIIYCIILFGGMQTYSETPIKIAGAIYSSVGCFLVHHHWKEDLSSSFPASKEKEIGYNLLAKILLMTTQFSKVLFGYSEFIRTLVGAEDTKHFPRRCSAVMHKIKGIKSPCGCSYLGIKLL